jgi:hypothetical protein
MRSGPRGAPEERSRGAAADPVALMRPLVIVGLHERFQAALERRPTGEVAATPEPCSMARSPSAMAR